jgi:excisionase family DNA binding protein
LNIQKEKSSFRSIPEFLTVPEVSKLLKVSRITVYRFAESGKIPCYKIGGLRFSLNDVLEYIEKNKKILPPTPTF